jgi:hypothetical protein
MGLRVGGLYQMLEKTIDVFFVSSLACVVDQWAADTSRWNRGVQVKTNLF